MSRPRRAPGGCSPGTLELLTLVVALCGALAGPPARVAGAQASQPPQQGNAPAARPPGAPTAARPSVPAAAAAAPTAPATRPATSQPADGEVSEAAIEALERQVKAHPADANLPVKLAAACLKRAGLTHDFRLYARAEAAAREALKRDAQHFAAKVALGTCYLGQHRFQEAVNLADEMLKAKPDAPEGLALRGDALVHLGDLPRAREAYEKLLTATPDLLAQTRVASLQFAEGDPKAAAATYEAAIRAGEEAAAAPALVAWCWLRLGELRFRTGDWDEAERCYTTAAAQLPDDPDVLDHLAELRAAQGEFEEALKLSERALAAAPRPEFHEHRGDILFAAGRADEAFASHQQALAAYLEASNAGYAAFHQRLAAMLCDVETLRDPAEAQRWARRDVQLRRTVDTFDAVAWALYHEGKFKEAASWMDRALREETADARVLYHAGLIYTRAADTKKGQLYLRKAAAANPKFNEFHFRR